MSRMVIRATALSAVVFFGAQGMADPQVLVRTFDQIDVVGNERFRDGDVLATAGLEVGQTYTEDDLRASVEALEFTGEFKEVRIFSDGPALTIEVDEEPEHHGELSFGLGYEGGTGPFGVVDLSLDDALGNGSKVRAGLRFAEEYTTVHASVANPSFWGGSRAGGVRLSYGDYRYDNALFDYTTAALSPYLSFDVGEFGTGEVRLTAFKTDISDVDPTASPIIQAEAGDRLVFGPGVSVVFGQSSDATAWAIRLDQDIYGGDSTISRTELKLSARARVVGSASIRTRIEVGTVRGLSGDETTAADRFTLGGASMRGFARGGISPRDVCLGCGAGGEDLITDLGGEIYAVARTEFVLPLFQDRPMLEPFLFADVGSVWSVDSATAPAGVLEDDQVWRSSAGLGLAIATPLGRFSATFAPHIDSEAYDDEAEFNLSFTREF
ncbi:MAG: BamA/TamA family outer membrane protein [Pseudomonadota bacterium]